MSRKLKMEEAITAQFAPTFLQVDDESHLHAGHSGARPEGETHYRITISAPSLAGKSRIEAHRAINDAMKKEFETGLHALAIKIVK